MPWVDRRGRAGGAVRGGTDQCGGPRSPRGEAQDRDGAREPLAPRHEFRPTICCDTAREPGGSQTARRAGLDNHHRRDLRRRRAGLHARHGRRCAPAGDGRRSPRRMRLEQRRRERHGQSNIPREEAAAILDLPGIRKGQQRRAHRRLRILRSHRRPPARDRQPNLFPLVGITPTVTAYLPEMHFTRGRMFQRGLHELIASNPCARQFTGFEIGDRRPIHGSDWTVVGHFDQGHTQQCVVYADVEASCPHSAATPTRQVSVMLQSAADFDGFRDAVTPTRACTSKPGTSARSWRSNSSN